MRMVSFHGKKYPFTAWTKAREARTKQKKCACFLCLAKFLDRAEAKAKKARRG